MNAIARTEVTALSVMPEEELIAVLESSLYPGAQPQSIKMVLGYCKASGLDPMQKPVHIVPIWDGKAKRMRDAIMPGIGLYRTQAARTGQLAGISEAEFGPLITETLGGTQITYPEWARVVVKRILPSGHIAEYEAREYWIENYATAGRDTAAPNTMWKKRTRGQVAKCAEAQALRKGFPEAVGSQPTAEEMEGKTQYDDERTIDMPTGSRGTPAPTQAAEPEVYPQDKFVSNFAQWEGVIKSRRKTHASMIAFIEAKGQKLSELQKAKINSIQVPLAEDEQRAQDFKDKEQHTRSEPSDPFTAPSYAQTVDKILKAKDMDALALAGDMIRHVVDLGQQAELQAKFEAREQELRG